MLLFIKQAYENGNRGVQNFKYTERSVRKGGNEKKKERKKDKSKKKRKKVGIFKKRKIDRKKGRKKSKMQSHPI